MKEKEQKEKEQKEKEQKEKKQKKELKEIQLKEKEQKENPGVLSGKIKTRQTGFRQVRQTKNQSKFCLGKKNRQKIFALSGFLGIRQAKTDLPALFLWN